MRDVVYPEVKHRRGGRHRGIEVVVIRRGDAGRWAQRDLWEGDVGAVCVESEEGYGDDADLRNVRRVMHLKTKRRTTAMVLIKKGSESLFWEDGVES